MPLANADPERISEFRHVFKNIQSGPKGNAQLFRILPLLRHFGYPAPLLEFTTNPLVALWFAYEASEPKEERVLVLFDQKRFLEKWPFNASAQSINANTSGELLPQDPLNPTNFIYPLDWSEDQEGIVSAREQAQKARYIYTWLEDNEAFIRLLEDNSGKRYLFRFRLPYEARDQVLNDLAAKGIDRVRLFPEDATMVGELIKQEFET